jgi:formamidopyrimidine-DNA glycosylase
VPEGHTLHRLALDHTRLLGGEELWVSSPQGRFADAAARVDGQKLNRVTAYGKHLFYEWATGDVVHVHLGLFGKFFTHPTPVGCQKSIRPLIPLTTSPFEHVSDGLSGARVRPPTRQLRPAAGARAAA